jgi:hypothetical protein
MQTVQFMELQYSSLDLEMAAEETELKLDIEIIIRQQLQ